MQAAANGCDVAFALVKRIRGRVHGVVSRHEVIGMLHRRAEHEACVGNGLERDGRLGFLEDNGFAGRNFRGSSDRALMRRDPGEVMIPGRLVDPAFSRTQTYIKIRHAWGRRHEAFDAVIFTGDNTCGASILER